jgi:predicted patatin/cPLA2 family phospholipase
MLFEGDTEVLARLFKKKRSMHGDDDEHSTIHPLLLALGGTMRGVYGGGQVTALEEFDLAETFDTMVGVSTGMPVISYFCAGQAALGASIYYEECSTARFMRISRLMLNADYLGSIFRGQEGNKALDQSRIRKSRSRIYAAVTCAETGEGSLLDLKEDLSDMVQAIRASIAIPRLTGGPVLVGTQRYLDGVGGFPFPAHEIIEQFNPTDVLILANSPEPSTPSFSTSTGIGALSSGYPPPVVKAFTDSSKRFVDELQWLRTEQPCRVAILWTDGEIGQFEQDPVKLRAAASRAQHHLRSLLLTAKDSASE